MKPLRFIFAIALLAALPATVGFAQSSPKTATSPATTKSPAAATTSTSPATAKSPATTASSPATTTTTAATSPAATSSAPSARTDLYHVHFAHAAPGKTNALVDSLKQPDP